MDELIIQDLERFVLDNPDLERLEAVLDDFNPFVALRWTRQEIRHSAFLRWLLDPSETHGLGSYYLRAFLKRLAHKSRGMGTATPSVIDVDGWEYSKAQVLSEWNNIDILIRDDRNQLICVVENKVDSTEHSQQLQRYREIVESQFPDYKKLLAFLTVEGDTPSDEAYVAFRYEEIAELTAETMDRRADQLSPDVATFIGHYLEMLRRHIVQDSEIQELCQRIYDSHRRALDVIFEHRPDRQSELGEFLLGLIAGNDALLPDHSSKSYIRFIPQGLDALPLHGSGWTPTKRLIVFELDQSSGGLRFKIILGPGRPESRDAIHAWVKDRSDAFNRAGTKLYPEWWSFHSEEWIAKGQYEELELDDLKEQVRTRFQKLIDTDLPEFIEALDGLADELGGDGAD